MREQEVRELYEAYLQVHQVQEEEVEELNEGRTTSLSALSRESQKRKEDKERGRPETQAEIHGRLAMGDFSPGASQKERARGGRQRLKDRGKVTKKGGKDMFEHILEHLVAEGYADTNESALAIMANMSEEWRQSIVEGGFNSSGRYDVGGGRTVGPVAGAVRSLFSGNLPKGQTYVPPSPQKGTNGPSAVPSSKGDSGKLTDFGAGGGKAKLKTGMSVGRVERQGRRNKGDYSG